MTPDVDLNFIAEQLRRLMGEVAELRADRRQDRQRFDSVERVLHAMPDQVALRLSVMFSSRLERIEDKLRELEEAR
jgi:hypothetical protein